MHISCIVVGVDEDIVLVVALICKNFCILHLQCSVNGLLLLFLACFRRLRPYVGFVLALSP